MSKIIRTANGFMETDYPEDAMRAVDGCGHGFKGHTYASNCGHCDGCDLRAQGEYESIIFHYFRPVRLAAGQYSPAKEQEAYHRALKGEL